MSAGVLALAAGGIGALGWMHNRDLRRAKLRRRSVFDDCRGILEDAELSHVGDGYPELHGRYAGFPTELSLISDTIQLRKLPVLWLLVTVHRPLAVPGVFDMMIRPSNAEYYSPHGSLTETLVNQPGWHEHAVIRSDNAAAIRPLLPRLQPHIESFLADERGKEVLVTPKGIRLVWRVDESQRGHYLALRQPLFEKDRVPRNEVEALLSKAALLADDIERAET